MSSFIKKEQENYKYSRINKIYELLKNTTYGMSITELSNEFDVSTKTIQRDLQELQKFGAIKEGRLWKINSKLAQDNLSSNEKMILGILDDMAKSAGKFFYSKAHSLLAQISQQLEHPIFTNISSETLEEKNIEDFELLEKAIMNKNEVFFEYQNYKYIVKPLKLAFFDGFWYLLALDVNKKDRFKKFHLKTIKYLEINKNIFKISTSIEDRLKHANSVWFNFEDPFIVRLFIEKEIKKYFKRKPLPSQMIVGEDSDGSIEIEIKITHEMEILPVIFWYIPYIKVLEPKWLASIVKEKVSNYSLQINSI